MTTLAVTERRFASAVAEAARLRGWRVHRTFDSRRSPSGFPCLVLARRGRLIFAELTADGRLAPEQRLWLEELRGTAAETYLWTPPDLPELERRLSGAES